MPAKQELELPPRASMLIESLRDMGYTLQTALADVVDNSITAGAKEIELLADTHGEVPAIGVLDDGSGMTREELLEAMRPGTISPLAKRPETDLGRFGLGLKTASFSQCRRLTVLTRKEGETSCAVWDLDIVAARDKWVVEVPERPNSIRWSKRLRGSGTLVVWEKLDRLVHTGVVGDRSDLVRQLDEASHHLAFVFHRFLSGREGLRVSMSQNGRELSPFDPFHSTHPATQHHAEEKMSLDGEQIRIWSVTLPHHDKVTKEEWKRHAGREGYVANQGFYLYRNRRLIVHGTWFRLARQAELTKLARVGIDIPNTLDAAWKIDVKKASAQPPPPVRDRLSKIIDKMGVASRRTYTSRGTRLTQDTRLPVWERVQDKNRISYEINEGHPFFASFRDPLDSETALEFERTLRLVASSLPISSLHADVSATPEAVGSAEIELDDLRKIVSSIWRTLCERGLSPDKIRKWMSSAEPFRGDWPRTSKILKGLDWELEIRE